MKEFVKFKQKQISVVDNALDLSNLSIEGIKEIEGLDQLFNLVSLNLNHNNITKIEGLESLKKLKNLKISFNNISEITGLSPCSNLKILNLYGNIIKKIKNLDLLSNLRYLNLGFNHISQIEGLDKLVNLERIDLSRNVITVIENFEKLIKLKEIDLRYNHISKIEALTPLSMLEKLDLRNNQINEIIGIENQKNLSTLLLDENPLFGYEQFIYTTQDIIKIMEYCRNKCEDKILYNKFINPTSSQEENLLICKSILDKIDNSDFLNINTFLERKDIKDLQNYLFIQSLPKLKTLSNQKNKNKKIKIHFIQLHSLKGISSQSKEKLEVFLFFLNQFWDTKEIEYNNILVYDKKKYRCQCKIEEMVSLSPNKEVDLIVFPENSIPYHSMRYLEDISKDNNIVIIGGLEHYKEDNHFLNKAFIIDNGILGFQEKQTPTKIRSSSGDIYENINLRRFPDIKIFELRFT